MFVKNAVVNMDWEVEGFFESKKDDTFVAAVQIYDTADGDLAVIFKDGKAFLLYNESTGAPMTRDEFTELLHDLVESYGSDVNLEEVGETCDYYICLSEGGEVDPEVADSYGLSDEDCRDIEARIEDLSGYTVVEYEDM